MIEMKKILAIDFSTASKKDEGTGYAFRKDGKLFVGSIKAYNAKKNAWERTFDIVNAIKDIIDELTDYDHKKMNVKKEKCKNTKKEE